MSSFSNLSMLLILRGITIKLQFQIITQLIEFQKQVYPYMLYIYYHLIFFHFNVFLSLNHLVCRCTFYGRWKQHQSIEITKAFHRMLEVQNKLGKFGWQNYSQANLDQLIVMISFDDFDMRQLRVTSLDYQRAEIKHYLFKLKHLTTDDEHQLLEFEHQIEHRHT